jgi:sortase A
MTRWIERGLLVVGATLGLWCAITMVEARYTSTLAPRPSGLLPGDAGTKIPLPYVRMTPETGAVLARLDAPSVHLSTSVLEGSDDGTLNRGAGHIEDTPLPGEAGNIGIAGHRDTVFRPLRNVKAGDPIDLTTAERVWHYRVRRTAIVGPDDVAVLDPTADPTLTLVTCYPFEFIGHAPRRFIVQAELIK